MSLHSAQFIVAMLAIYAAIGLALAGVMLLGGLRRIDSAASSAPFRVKLLWVPGMVSLWPLMLARSLGWRPREDRP